MNKGVENAMTYDRILLYNPYFDLGVKRTTFFFKVSCFFLLFPYLLWDVDCQAMSGLTVVGMRWWSVRIGEPGRRAHDLLENCSIEVTVYCMVGWHLA